LEFGRKFLGRGAESISKDKLKKKKNIFHGVAFGGMSEEDVSIKMMP